MTFYRCSLRKPNVSFLYIIYTVTILVFCEPKSYLNILGGGEILVGQTLMIVAVLIKVCFSRIL